MAQSPEYPDLPWVPPASYTGGRAPGRPSVIVIHTTEGSAHSRSAEDGAAYDQRRTDGTSAHYYVDSDTIVQCVRTTDRAHTARGTGNNIGVHYELCGRSGTLDWSSPYAVAMLQRAARQAARDAQRHGIPVVKLGAAELRAGQRGFTGHRDISQAWGESDHTDPGTRFPWTSFLTMVREHLEDDMTTKAEFVTWLKDPAVRAALATAIWHTDDVIPAPGAPKAGKNADGTPVNTHWGASSFLRDVHAKAAALQVAATAQGRALATLTGQDPIDEQAIVTGVLQGLDPAAIAAAIPQTVAQQVVDLLSQRLQS